VSRALPSWNRSILTEIYLCHACSCPEILSTRPGRIEYRDDAAAAAALTEQLPNLALVRDGWGW
jgi:hypothetical protein